MIMFYVQIGSNYGMILFRKIRRAQNPISILWTYFFSINLYLICGSTNSAQNMQHAYLTFSSSFIGQNIYMH
jgi:hypothetical protein